MKGKTKGQGVFNAAATNPSRRKVKQELIKHGATRSQADAYCNFVDYFEDLSKQDCVTEKHHILPENCGWWKKYENCKWNHARISWQLHGSLHAFLCHIFPTNQALFRASQITSSNYRGNERKLKLKSKITRFYQDGRSSIWIGKKYSMSNSQILAWLREWNVPIRSSAQASALARVGNKKSKYKDGIIRLYEAGQNLAQIGNNFHLSDHTVRNWLIEWNIPLRSLSQAISFAYVGNRKARYKEEIIQLYRSGNSCAKIEEEVRERVGVDRATIFNWLKEWETPLRSRSEANKVRWATRSNSKPSELPKAA